MDSKKPESLSNLLLRNVPPTGPLLVEIDVIEFMRVLSGIEAGGALLSKYAAEPKDVQDAYNAACGAMRQYFDMMLVAKYPPSYKA